MNGSESSRMLTRISIAAAIFGLSMIGLYIRIANLSYLSFWADEFSHVNAAVNLLNTGQPLLNSGFSYTRALPYTYLVAASFDLLGVNEGAARLPSVIFGVLIIPLAYICGRYFVNRLTGIFCALLIAFTPWAVAWSRECRMYTLFQLLFLALLIVFYAGIEKENNRATRTAKISWPMLLLALVLLGACLMVHSLSIMFIPIVLTYCLYVLAEDFIRNRKAARQHDDEAQAQHTHLRYYNLIFFCFMIVALFLKFKAYFMGGLIAPLEQNVELLAQPGDLSRFIGIAFRKDYISYLVNNYKLLPSLLLLAVGFIALIRSGRKGIFIIISLMIPLLLHVFILSWESARYVFYLLPIYILIISVGAVTLFRVAWNYSVKYFNKQELPKVIMRLAVVAIAIIFVVIYVPFREANAVHKFKHGPTIVEDHPNYRQAGDFVKSRMKPADVIMSTIPSASGYYIGRTDYFLRQVDYESSAYRDKNGQIREAQEGSLILYNYEEFERVVEENDHIWLIADNRLFSQLTDPSVRDFVKKYFVDHSTALDGTIWIYEWNGGKSLAE